MMLSSHLYLGHPLGLVVKGFHLNIFLAALASGILCVWPNRLSIYPCVVTSYYEVRFIVTDGFVTFHFLINNVFSLPSRIVSFTLVNACTTFPFLIYYYYYYYLVIFCEAFTSIYLKISTLLGYIILQL